MVSEGCRVGGSRVHEVSGNGVWSEEGMYGVGLRGERIGIVI